MELFLIGLRNIFRNKRRTILNAIALTIGITIMIIFTGWIRGYFTGLYNAIINFETGHIQVLNSDYMANSDRLPLDINLSNYNALAEKLRKDPRVQAVTPRINFPLRISNGRESVWVLGRAIDPVQEPKVTVIEEHCADKTFFNTGKGLVIGKSLAEKLDLKLNDPVFITAYDKYSVENILDEKITGIFNFGYPVMDDNIIFCSIDTADRLLSMGGEVNRLVIKLKDGYDDEQVTADLNRSFGTADHTAYDWKRFAEVLISAVRADSSMAWLMAFIIYIFIILGILNSMSMSVHERTQEIGTLRAIGMRKNGVIKLLVYEGIGIAVVSIGAAMIIAGILGAFLQLVGFDFASFMPENIPIPFGKTFKADFRFYDFILGAVLGGISAVVGSIIPAMRASKIVIAKAMGSAHVD
ncbi:MAG: ABC transporter permease [Spirochaetales bacterium]|nr:ABC transporter permease [Spirochaetales bacterium]